MSDISHHIQHFLSLSDSVIIPGFGKLSRQYSPAELNPFENRISAPFYTLNFDFDLQEDNADLLINYIAEQENISFEDAAELVYYYKKSLLQGVFNNETVSIAGIASFSFDGTQVQFQALDNNPLINPFFDYPNLEAVPLKREKLDSLDPNHRKKTRTKLSIPFIISIIALTILLIIFVTVNFGGRPKIIISNTVLTEDSLSVKSAEDSMQLTDTGSDSIKPETISEPNIAQEQSKEYYIVVGTFADEENAQRTEKRLIADGYTCNLKKYNNGKVRVAVALRVANESELKEKLEHIKLNYEKGAFVVKN
jgi:hypothetical protein